MTSEECRSVDNGIWMCRTHAAEIDRDVIQYNVEVLRDWKKKAEERAKNNRVNYLQSSRENGVGSSNEHKKSENDIHSIPDKFILRQVIIGIAILFTLLFPFFWSIDIYRFLPLGYRLYLFFIISILLLIVLWNIETNPNIASKIYNTITEDDLLSCSPHQLMAEIIGSFGEDKLLHRKHGDGFRELVIFKRMSFGGWETNRINYLKIEFKFTLEYYNPTVFFLHPLNTRETAIRMLSLQGFVLQELTENTLNIPRMLYFKKECMNIYLFIKKNHFIEKVLILNCLDDVLMKEVERMVINNEKNIK